MRDPVAIRAHHLLCVQGFQGHGYSPEFTAALAALTARLEGRPDTLLEIVAGTDAVCEPCPHRAGDFCRKDPGADARVRATDARVLGKLGWSAGKRGGARSLFAEVNARFPSKAHVADVCGNCSWKGKCLWHSALPENSPSPDSTGKDRPA